MGRHRARAATRSSSRSCLFWTCRPRLSSADGKRRWNARGGRVADADLMIAATALAHGASVVTGNRKHYECIEVLRIEDWIRGKRTAGE